MKFTIDTEKQTIEIHGSFKFEDFDKMRNGLPTAYRDFSIGLAEQPSFTWQYVPPLQIDNPSYPVVPLFTPPLPKPPFWVTCSCSSGTGGCNCLSQEGK